MIVNLNADEDLDKKYTLNISRIMLLFWDSSVYNMF